MAENTLAALLAYEALGLPLERAQAGADAIELSRWRGEALELPGGGFVVNDAYNANPTSMRAALRDLVARAEGRRRVAILGEMAELGAESSRYHEEVGALLSDLGIELVVAVGESARPYLQETGIGHRSLDSGRSLVRRRCRAPPAGRRDPRQGVAGGRARRHPGLDRETG